MVNKPIPTTHNERSSERLRGGCVLQYLRVLLIGASMLLCLYFGWSWYASIGHSGMYQIQFGSRAVSILEESGRYELTVIRPLHLAMKFLEFTRWVNVPLPNRVGLSLDTSAFSQWRFADFKIGYGTVRSKTYGGSGEAYIPEELGLNSPIQGSPVWSPPLSAWIIGFPCWFAVLFTAMWPSIVVARLIRRAMRKRTERLIAANVCPQCRYDLRATPLRCPECGWRRPPQKGEVT